MAGIHSYQVDRVQIPPIGFRGYTYAECLKRMGVQEPDRARPGDSTYALRENDNDMPTNIVFFQEHSECVDLVSRFPSGQYILEQWGGDRPAENIGFRRHTFIKRENTDSYEYLGEYIIVGVFGAAPKQWTLWQRC